MWFAGVCPCPLTPPPPPRPGGPEGALQPRPLNPNAPPLRITPKPPRGQVNLKEPSKTVLVQLTRNGCAMSVVTGYREYAKFNLRKLAEVDEEEAAAAGGGKKKQ